MAFVSPERPRWKYLASFLPELVSLFLAGAFAHLGSGVGLGVVLPGLVVGVVLIGIAEYFVTYAPLLDYREEQLSTFFEEYLSMVESEIEEIPSSDVDVRANIMLKTGGFREEPTVSVEYVSDTEKYSREELDLEFDVGQGVCGMVIQNNGSIVSTSTPSSDGWGYPWDTTQRIDRVTSDLCTIIGIPIYHPNDEDQSEPIGVLIIDSEHTADELFDEPEATDWDDYNFGDTEIVRRVGEHAKNVGILL